MSEFAQSGDEQVAAIAIVIAALSNTLVKCGMAFVLAGPALCKPLAVATADPHCRARRGFLLPALHVVLAGH